MTFSSLRDFSHNTIVERLSSACEPSYLSRIPTPLPGLTHPQYSYCTTSFVVEKKERFSLGRTVLQHPSLARKPWG